MLKKTAIFVAIALIYAGCAGKTSLETDEFTGAKTLRLEDNRIKSPLMSSLEIQLNAKAVAHPDGSKVIVLILQYQAKDWLFIGEEGSLEIKADGVLHSFDAMPGGIYRNVTTGIEGALIFERVMYVVDPDELQEIVYASDVQARIHGEHFYQDATIGSGPLSRLRVFLQQCKLALGITPSEPAPTRKDSSN